MRNELSHIELAYIGYTYHRLYHVRSVIIPGMVPGEEGWRGEFPPGDFDTKLRITFVNVTCLFYSHSCL